MILTNKAIEDLVISVAGDDIPPLINLLKNKKNVSEFELAEKLNITVNQVRNMLYRLQKANLVTFTRKKDKKKGWYIYYWTLDMDNIRDAIFMQLKNRLAEFKERLKKESESKFFVCPNKCSRLSMEEALEVDFKCQECGQLLVEQDNRRTIENIKQRIAEMEQEIKEEEELRAKEAEKLAKKARKPLVKKVAKKIIKKPVKVLAKKKAVIKKIEKKPKKAEKIRKEVIKKIEKKPKKAEKVVKKTKEEKAKSAEKKSFLKGIIKKIAGKRISLF